LERLKVQSFGLETARTLPNSKAPRRQPKPLRPTCLRLPQAQSRAKNSRVEIGLKAKKF
jgi:hypothetical protein